MAIERTSIPEGLEVDSSAGMSSIFDKIASGDVETSLLPPGVYDITPKQWRNNVYRYHLHVFQSGLGACEMIPRFPDAVTEILAGGQSSNHQKGTRVIFLSPGGEIATAVSGPSKDGLGIVIYELVRLVPGPSPVNPNDYNN